MNKALFTQPIDRSLANVSPAELVNTVASLKGRVEGLERELFIDTVTGLASRRAFSETVARIASHGVPLAVFVVDIDRFHMIHHAIGNAGAERALRAVGDYLRRVCADARIVARLYGDEFAVAMHCQSPEAAYRACLEVVNGLAKSDAVAAEDRGLIRGITGGVTHTALSGRKSDELLRDAMTALHEGKADGGRCTRLFAPDQRERAIHELETELAIRRGLVTGEFEPWYQPVFDLTTGEPVGFEALVRWNHPTRGLLSPSEFLGIAEACGAIEGIGEIVARKALEDACRLQRCTSRSISMALNVSPRVATHPAFLEQLVSLLRETGFPPSQLILEITEGTLMEPTPALLNPLKALRRLGVRIALDDFGAGYSSLGALHDLPIDVLKIDSAFIKRLSPKNPNDSIVATIAEIGRRLGHTIIAEGVETADTARALRSLNIAEAQGYWFGKAMPFPEAERWFCDRSHKFAAA